MTTDDQQQSSPDLAADSTLGTNQQETPKIPEIIFINSNDTSQGLIDSNQREPKNHPATIYGLSGIVNTGNTCYMNSAIQALSHNYFITEYFFNNRQTIIGTLLKNARKILEKSPAFKLDVPSAIVTDELKKKIAHPDYNPSVLTQEENVVVLNHTMTFQMIKLLENMWNRNCTVMPTSFRKVFSEVRSKFFFGNEQHDAEEAYSCIIQQIQEELAEKRNVKFKTTRLSVQKFIERKNQIMLESERTTDVNVKARLFDQYNQMKKSMRDESIIVEAYREMRRYYSNAHNRITEIFTGFTQSITTCPLCSYTSNKFDANLHLPLQIPHGYSLVTIEECLADYCKTETLDESNLWQCESCKKNVKATKKLQLWTAPPVLVILLKRFDTNHMIKNNRLVTYPLKDLDVGNIVSSIYRDAAKCYKYSLQSVINHQDNLGSMKSGHYLTYCRDEDSGKWFAYNDQIVGELREQHVVTASAYLLFYMRQDMLVVDI